MPEVVKKSFHRPLRMRIHRISKVSSLSILDSGRTDRTARERIKVPLLSATFHVNDEIGCFAPLETLPCCETYNKTQ